MAKEKIPTTAAIRVLRAAKAEFTPFQYDYQDHGGTRLAARELNLDEYLIIKTLIFKDNQEKPLIMLMHGDREVSTKNLARALDVKNIEPCDPIEANRLTGYQVGGISPFGTHRRMTVYMEKSIAELPRLYINGGRRGFLLEMEPRELSRVLSPILVVAAQV